MSVDRTRRFLEENAPDITIVDTGEDTSTVDAAAATLGTSPAQIAKTLVLRGADGPVLVVASGTARIDNKRFKACFGLKPRFVSAEEARALTGQPVGGVGPFGHPEQLRVHCDESLRAFDVVHPAAGSPTSAFAITPERLAALAEAEWVDVTTPPDQGVTL